MTRQKTFRNITSKKQCGLWVKTSGDDDETRHKASNAHSCLIAPKKLNAIRKPFNRNQYTFATLPLTLNKEKAARRWVGKGTFHGAISGKHDSKAIRRKYLRSYLLS